MTSAGLKSDKKSHRLRFRSPAVDARHLDAISSALGTARTEELLGLAVLQLAERAVQLRFPADADDLKTLRHEMHNLKGMVGSFGLRGVAGAAKSVEDAQPGRELEAALKRFQGYVELTVDWIGRRPQQVSDAPPSRTATSKLPG